MSALAIVVDSRSTLYAFIVHQQLPVLNKRKRSGLKSNKHFVKVITLSLFCNIVLKAVTTITPPSCVLKCFCIFNHFENKSCLLKCGNVAIITGLLRTVFDSVIEYSIQAFCLLSGYTGVHDGLKCVRDKKLQN